MFDKLSVKLMLPIVLINLFALIILLAIDDLSKTATVFGLLIITVVQVVIFSLSYQQRLAQRFSKLQVYLAQVVSTETAPEKPLHDDNDDDLARITNELSSFIEHLARVIDEIRVESRTLRHGADDLAEQIGQSDQDIIQSAEKIQSLAHAIEHVAQTSSILSSNTAQVNTTTSGMVSMLAQGKQSSDTSEQTIETFANEVQGMATDLSALQEECVRIGTVLDVIRGIAEQTNLLALNAAIEAARAGEQGRGFAVVADEVRALAHRTQESTVEIQSMVEGLQTKSDNAVQAIERGQHLTEQSLTHTQQVTDAFEQIAKAFNEVDQLTAQIANGTEEQQQSTAQMNQNVMQVVQLTNEVQQRFANVTEQAQGQKQITREIDTTLTQICV